MLAEVLVKISDMEQNAVLTVSGAVVIKTYPT